ncbi:unnamed protein product [Orchesella dallaii]|uniref:Carrier domain-containing protein n=1 Tax=Orchesella dallaii TaxID=48710 RepID=A0ABP1RHD4_9HEXA
MAQSSRAWVTYVPNDEKIVTKALVLARSLKRVCSAIKTVVFASHSLNEELTEKLLATFDLVIPLPSSYKLPIEEEALIQALTLKNFEKCVYLSPECMILKNCDELFDKFTCFGICNDECVQESTPFHIGVIGYIPSLTNSKSLKHFLLGAKNGKHKECQSETSSKFRVRTWLRNNVKDIQVFDKKYNVSLYLKKGAIECLEPDAAIITFLNKHPLDGHLNGSATTGALESHAQFSYLPDHSIGNTILFPGAGFLEICLCAGHAAAQGYSDTFTKPHRAVGLTNLEIVSPLAISDLKACTIQTVAKLAEKVDEEGGSETSYKIEVYHWHDAREEGEDSITNDGKWILHANASFLPFVSCSFDKKQREINVVEICNTWASKEWNSSEIYENIAKLGLRLGSSFQRINKAWFPDDGNEALFEMKVLQQREREEYMVHPVIGDAMIQAIMMWSNRFSAKSGAKWKKRLQIPVKVGEFTWFPSENIEEDNAFIYCFANEEGNTTALLLNQNGEALARMGAVEFIETSAKFVEGLIHQQTVVMPKLWEEVWRPCPDALQNSISPLVLKELPHIKELEIRSCMEETNNDGDLNEFEHVCKLTLFQFLKALSRLGFQPQAGERFTTAELFTLLSIKNKFKNYVGFFLEKMVQQNYLSEFEQENWIVQPQLETDLRNIVAIETATLIFPEETAQCDYRLVCEIGGSLAEILTGKVDPLSLIFPEDPRKPNAEGIYEMVASQMEPAVRYSNATLATIFPTIKTSSSKNCLRVLEIGSGTGVNTTLFFDCIHSSLEKEELDLEYLYTDISSTFFAYAKENPKLEKYLKHITFKKLDIEIDPISQGFSPEYFDVILAAEVLHVTKNVRKAVENLGKLIKPSGFIQIYETVRDSPILMFVFGLLDGYWQFQDFDLRKKSPVLSELKWKQILEENGFTDVSTVTNYNGVHAGIYAYRQVSASVPVADSKCSRTWMIFGDDFTSQLISKLEKKMNTIGRNMLTVQRPNIQHCQDGEHELRAYIKSNLNSTKMQLEGILYMWGVLREDQHDQSKISFPFLSLCQELVENIDSGILKSAPKLFILTNGLHSSNDPAMFNPSSSTLLGIAKSVPIEYNNLTVNVLDIHDNVDDCVDQVFFNLWAGENKNDFHSFRNGKRFVRRMKSKKISSNNLSLPSACDRFQLALPATRQIADLEFTHLDKWNLGENQVEIHVKAMALNFRDVFTVLKPIPIFEEINTIGMDFSGVVTSVGPKVVDFKVGDNVIGFNSHNNLALPSHILVDQNLILHLPSGMTHCEGATLPAVFMTSIYCLFNLARIQPSETVLIHTASGGVGLSAIQLALQHKAKIIATAGSRRKRTYLKNLGVSHVFNSRTTEFSNEILEVTNGRGVDIVLNSLTGPGFKEASLKALATNGRFVEMSKLSVWSKEEVAELRGDVEYHMIDIKAMSDEFIQDVMKTVKTRLKGGTTEETIKALAFERFDALDIRSALFYLQQAKHIGKVVCVMPEIKRENSRLKTVTQLFNERSTYIVTGGLGGIGFEVVKWMLRNGAKYIAIVSRNSSPKSEIAEQIQKFNEKDDKHIRTFSVDVSMYEKCKKLFEKIKSPDSEFPAIRGIMHAAGLLDDATIENQTWDKFQSTYNSKVNGSWNLHLLTKTLNLEHFVLFSSISSVLGAPGQANYSASNNFEDALAHYRHGQGLPAISINWGHWAEVGIATEADFPGVRPISTSEGLLLLGSVLRSPGTTQVVACNIESFPLLSNMFPNLKQYADDQSLFGEQKNQFNSSITSDEFWKEVDSAEDRLEKIEIFKKHIKIFVRNILKMEANELIGDSTDFQSLGVDSLMMLEMKNSIQNLLGSRLVVTPSHIRDCNNVELLANRFMDLIESKEEEDELPSLEELRQLIHEDCQLPEHIIAPETSAVKESDIQTVLLTGSTGTLGRYILQDILKSPSIRKVYCLVRKIGNSSPAERLKNVLEKRGVENDEKIEALEGDISKDSLGLDEQLYHQLSSEVDAVVHCAVKSDHVAKYWKAPVSRLSNVRNVNVLGTRRVIEFATNVRAKHIFHASSLLVVTATNEMDGTLTEDWQEDTAYDCLTNNSGYVITKFVSEQLVKQAWIRGLPCKVLRFALVSGDGETGELDIFSSHYMLRLLAFLKLECMQDAPMPSLLIPPNDCSKALIGICFNEKANSGVYNVVPARPQLEQVFINVAAEIGIKVELVTLTEFLKRLNTMEGDDNRVISQLKIIYTLDENRTMEILCGFSSIRKWIENSSDDFFVSRKLKKLMPTFQEGLESAEVIMRRDIEFAKKSGAFKAIGLQQGNGSLHRV